MAARVAEGSGAMAVLVGGRRFCSSSLERRVRRRQVGSSRAALATAQRLVMVVGTRTPVQVGPSR
jgi:hypothetical protein